MNPALLTERSIGPRAYQRRLRTNYRGTPIPGTSVKPFTKGLGPDDLPACYAGTGASVCWYEPPHPLAMSNELCDLAVRFAPTLKRSRSVRSPRFGAMIVAPQSMPVLWHLFSAVASANAFRARVTWLPPVDLVILHYSPGTSMPWHDDATAFTPTQKVGGLVLSAIVQLSDPMDYEGGLVEFDTGSGCITMPTTRGTVAVFPSTTPHRITPITKGERWSMTTFLPGPAAAVVKEDSMQTRVLRR